MDRKASTVFQAKYPLMVLSTCPGDTTFEITASQGEGEGEDECNPDETPPGLHCNDTTVELDGAGIAHLFSAFALYIIRNH